MAGWGDFGLAKSKRVAVSLPIGLLDELDGLVIREQVSRSNVIRSATAAYVAERKRQGLREALEQGYREMAPINLRLACEAFPAEAEADVIGRRLVSGV